MVDHIQAIKAEIGDAQAIHDLISALKMGDTPKPPLKGLIALDGHV
jgi:hypothetical protein